MPKQTALSSIGPPQNHVEGLPPAFSDRLREETKLVHREAERTGFIAELIRGRATTAGYALFLRNLASVYAALEAALDRRRDIVPFAAFARPELRRLPSLLNDIATIETVGRPGGKELAEAKAYVGAIERAAADGPRLVAHAYARYLGDLSGGQILKPILARSLGLPDDALSFYDFPGIDDVAAAKDAMRGALDTIPMDSADAAAVIDESVAAFQHNIALSCAVARALDPVS